MTSALKTATLNTELSLKQAAHDIRSPLSALNILSRSSHSQMSEEARNLMLAAIQRINDIATQILNQSSATESRQECVTTLIDQIISEKRLKFQNRDLKVEFVYDFNNTHESQCQVRKCEVQRAISNLIDNAVESIQHSHGKVTVAIETTRNHVNIQISDNGKGIPKNIISKIGTRGFSFGKSTGESGSGLGVFHAKSVVESHGGDFQISSIQEKGTTVILRLPR